MIYQTSRIYFLFQAKHFSRDDVAQRGFAKLFQHLADEEKEHAQELMAYLNKRGGLLSLKPIHVSNQ